jgi:hypothetical protein
MINLEYRAVLTIVAVAFLAVGASAQRSRPAPKPVASKVDPAVAAEVRAGAEKASGELKKVTRFIFLLGGIAQGIEDLEANAKAGKATRAAIDQNEQFKQSVVKGIQNLQAGLAALEVEFRTKSGLRPFVSTVDGVTATAGVAEDQALEGSFKEAGRTLILVVEKLSDALAALP